MLKCEQALEQIDLVLDDGDTPGGELQAHIAACDGCRRKYDSYKRLEQRLRSTASNAHALQETPSRSFKVAAPNPWRSRMWMFGVAAAACVMLGCAMAVYFSYMTPVKPIVENRAAPPSIPVPPPQKAVAKVDTLPAPTIEAILAIPDKALKNEREKLLTDVRAVESFLLRCLPISRPENRG